VSDTPRFWFAATRDGRAWGWPLTWQGWLVYAVWFVGVVVLIPYLNPPQHPLFALAVVLGLVIALVCILYWKGEPLRAYRRQ